jgi:hypothetical protein
MKKLLVLAMAALSVGAMAQTYTGAGFQVPDNNAGGASSSVVISGASNASIVSVGLLGASHTWVADWVGTLSNGVTTIDLFNRPGNSTAGWNSNLNGDYFFKMGAAQTWNEALAAQNPGNSDAYDFLAGDYKPAGDFAAFGSNLNGTWTLKIADLAGADIGGIQAWNITVAPVPEPASMAALALGAAGVIARRRRKSN